MAVTASHAQVYLRRAVPTWVRGVTDWTAIEPDPVKLRARVPWLNQDRRTAAQRSPVRPKLPYIGLQMIGPMTPVGRGEARPFVEDHPSSITLTVSTPSVGDTAGFRLGYQEIRHVRAAGESESDVRDRLLDQVQAGVEPVDAATVGLNQINLTRQANKFGLLRVLLYESSPGVPLGVTGVVDATEPLKPHTSGTLRARVRLYFYGFDGSSSTYTDIATAVDSMSGREILAGYGVGIQSPRPGGIDISNDSAGAFEGRSSLDIFFAVRNDRFATAGPTIETIGFSGEYLRAPNHPA